MINYKDDKSFTKEQIIELFKSVNWISANYPDLLYKALVNSETVITAWDDDKLVGLARCIDDGEMLAFIHYVLVNPNYQGMHIGKNLIEHIINKYKNYLYIEVMPEDSKNQLFYEKLGFKKMENGIALQICHY